MFGSEARTTRQVARQDGAPAQGIRGGALIAAVPVIMVNATAFIGQFAWVRQHVPWWIEGQVLFALTLEAIAIYLAWHAHQAQMANDSAGRLKLGAYVFALVIGAMNYSHYAVHWHPNALAVGLGLMSTLSPWLWGIHSRRASRDALMAQGLVEPHAVRLGANRWMWHAARSMQVMYHATWVGEVDPKRAIESYEARHAARQASAVARRETAQAVAQPARQETGPAGVPAVAQPAVPTAPQLPAPAVPALPQGPVAPSPGTQVNGKTVQAIVALTAAPRVRSHKIGQDALDQVTLHLLGLSADALPSQRDVAAMLCPDQAHDHRRQAIPLINARKAQGVPPVVSLVRPQPNGHHPQMIAVPAGTVPGGIQANG